MTSEIELSQWYCEDVNKQLDGEDMTDTDIATRLRVIGEETGLVHCFDAADEIERLTAALEEIVRESNGMNKGAVAQKLALKALGEKT